MFYRLLRCTEPADPCSNGCEVPPRLFSAVIRLMLEEIQQHKFGVTQVCIQHGLQKYLEKGEQGESGRSA